MERDIEQTATHRFGSLLRTHRLAAGLTQAGLAQRAGVSTRGIQDIERGITHPYRATAALLIRALGLADDDREAMEAAAAPVPRQRRSIERRDGRPGSLAPVPDRRYATVLCTEMIAASMADALPGGGALRMLLERSVNAMQRAVERHGGTVLERTDHGITAVFGAPRAQETHAGCALLTAVRIRETTAAPRETARYGWGIPMSIRVGVASGDVILSAARPSGGGSGIDVPAVQKARRLAREAPDNAICATPSTVRLAGPAFRWASLGEGLGQISQLQDAQPVGARLRERVELGLTRLVDRRAEIRQLLDAWEIARGGRGQVVALVGDAGIGKSRLIRELARRLGRQGVTPLEGSCFAFGDPVSHLPFIEILKQLFELDGQVEEHEARRQIIRRLAELGLDTGAVGPSVLSLLGYPPVESAFSRLPAHLARRRTTEAVVRVLIAAARASGGLALVVEDLHCVDHASEDVLGALVEAMEAAPLLVVLACRPVSLESWRQPLHRGQLRIEHPSGASAAAMMHALAEHPSVRMLTIAPLAAETTRTIVRTVLGETATRGVEDSIVERAEGNPLFAEELAHTLSRRTDPLRPERRTGSDLPGSILPATIRDVLLERVDVLRPELKAVLQIAAVIGREFSRQILATVAPSGVDLDGVLLRLEMLGFVRLTRLAPVRTYRFEQGLTCEAIEQSLPDDARAHLHDLVTQAAITLGELQSRNQEPKVAG